jgi:hypothetical protein
MSFYTLQHVLCPVSLRLTRESRSLKH